MLYAVALAPKLASTLPATRWLDRLRGKVRWIEGSGWCDQGFLEIMVGPVAAPTLEQIRFVQKERSHLGNFLEIRRALQSGQCIGFGTLLPAETKEKRAQLQALGFSYTVSVSKTWRPLTYEARDPQLFSVPVPGHART